MDILSFLLLAKKALFAIGPFLLLLGILIFIHELGHFLAARYFGVRVEVFSLGFGPKILKYKKGDTVYCISLLPLGGYVKMFGDNPLEEIPNSEKDQGFLYKKVPAKWLIAFAGPLMNLIFTLLAFFFLASSGVSTLPAELGDILPKSPAWEAGFRSGDQILSVNGQEVSYYQELNEIIKQSPNQMLLFQVQSKKNKIKSIQAQVEQKKNSNPLEWRKTVGNIEGFNIFSTGLRVGVIYNSPAYKTGLRTFDEIVAVNGKDLRYWRELEKIKKNKPITLTVKREGEAKPHNLKMTGSISGIEPAEFYIERVGPKTPAEAVGFQKGDRLLAINGKPVENWEMISKKIKSYTGQPFSITYQRKEKKDTVSLSPKSLFVEGNIKKKFMLGIGSGGLQVVPKEIIKKQSAMQALTYSVKETGEWLSRITAGLVRLIQGKISLRTMGGPVAIGRVAHSSFHQGLQSFLFIMALISLNLFFLNLLPIPMLDGGHILFFTIEGILRRPLPVKKLIVAQQLGLVVLLSFMGFTVFNDIYNWLQAW